MFSVLYTLNIAVSNTSLAVVSVPLHQTIRATTPAFTVAIYAIFFQKFYSSATYISLIPVITGVVFATYDSLGLTVIGFGFTIFGAQLAAVKTIFTNHLQTSGLHLNALEILYYITPLAAIQAGIWAYMNGEVDEFIVKELYGHHLKSEGLALIILNCAMAFMLNWSSFTANKVAGALSMTIAGNVKQVATIALAMVCFHLPYGPIHLSGIVITLVGSAFYTVVELGTTGATARDSILPLATRRTRAFE